MQRFDLKAYRQIKKSLAPFSLSRNKENSASLALYLADQKIQKFFNTSASLFWDKKAKNPNQKSYVNDHTLVTDKTNINYSDLDYIHQPRVFDCVDTSIRMVLNYHKKKCSVLDFTTHDKFINDFEKKFNDRKIHFFSGRKVKEVQSYGSTLILKSCKSHEQTIQKLSDFLYKCGPLILGTNEIGGHLIVLKGIINNNIIIYDPWSGPNLTYSFDDFKKIWDGRMLYIMHGYSKHLENILSARPKNDLKILSL